MLHDSLRALTYDASHLLEGLLTAGAEIPFEVGDSAGRQDPMNRGGNVTMFAYRPLTADFVSSHADQLRTLPTFESAAQNLSRTRGMIAYLRVRDEPVLDVGELTHARLGALAFLAAVWNDAEHFDQWGDRFEKAYNELESVALAERLVTTVFIPIHGVALEGGSVNLGAGIELIAPEELDDECADRFSDTVAGAECFCSVSVDAPSDAPTPMPAVRESARSLLTALRLFKPGSVSLGLTAQAEIGGAWHSVSMPFSGRARDDAWSLLPGEDEELRQFVSAVRRVERRTRIAWSLKRFEMGLERGVPAEGLTDFLVAIRSLLEANDDTGKAALPARVSSLCARDSERVHVRASVEAAFALERLAVDGHIGRADRKRLAKQPPLEVIADTERYLRALLHDLVCGYLSTDLKKLADEILEADGEPVGEDNVTIDPVYLEPVPAPGSAPAPDPQETVEFQVVFDDTAEILAVDLRGADNVTTLTMGDVDDNVWSLRPAAEIKPAPEVSDELPAAEEPLFEFLPQPEPTAGPGEPDEQMSELAHHLVEDFDTAFAGSMETGSVEAAEPTGYTKEIDITAVPEWDPQPERRPVGSIGDVHTSVGDAATGFTFDFKKVDLPAAPERANADARFSVEETIAGSEPASEFPIPEFGVPMGQVPAVTRSDDEVDGSDQRQSFNSIMDQNFVHPPRDPNERATTPLGRDGRPHLFALDGAPIEAEAPEPAKPRIVHPDIFGSNTSAPLAPQETVEWDVLTNDNSAEEAAQLAWSEQFLRRADEPVAEAAHAAEAVVEEPEDEDPAPRGLELVQPQVELQAEPQLMSPSQILPSEPSSVAPPPASSEEARTQSIGPATIEFRPIVDPDTDDPDDFAGAV